jgi:hypothetical protein
LAKASSGRRTGTATIEAVTDEPAVIAHRRAVAVEAAARIIATRK